MAIEVAGGSQAYVDHEAVNLRGADNSIVHHLLLRLIVLMITLITSILI